ncbi:MAG: OmpA family protein [bacterium]|nr:OmpA family protein [bacterium]
MKSISIIAVTILAIMVLSGPAPAADLDQLAELMTLMDSAKAIEADVFAPTLWKKANESYHKVQRSIDGGKSTKDISNKLTKAMEYVENSIRASEVGKLTLQEYLAPRNNARKAKAPIHAPETYHKAEAQFVKATKKVESGDVKGGLKEAEKSVELFEMVEMVAIEIDLLGKADRLIEKAEADGAGKYALSTLDKARTARDKSYAILTGDRYNRTEAVEESNRAEYEAMHASNIALSVRSLSKNDQAWEKLMLLYEIQMNRVGASLGVPFLPFDNGPLAAADAMINKVTALQEENQNLSQDSEFLSGAVAEQLKSILLAIEEPFDGNDPVAMGKAVEQAMLKMKEEYAVVEQQLNETQDRLATLEAANAEVESELALRVEKEQKFIKAKTILNPSEGEVLFNSSNDVVLRLTGISFDVGQSTIKDDHVPLLKKVEEVIKLFPYAFLVVEGHTDGSGDPSSNMLLSEKRAYAITQYIRQSMLISADKIKSMGFGMDKPVASNQTEEGRSQNRRIDIIIQM